MDDDEASHYLHKRLIHKNFPDAKVEAVTDGRLALRHLLESSSTGENCPTHIWLDLKMPRMDGWNFLEALAVNASRLNCRPQITIVSTAADVEERTKANRYGISAVVEKFMTSEQCAHILSSMN